MELNKYIDHTNLKATATKKDIEKLCKEAIEYDFASVCINPCYVSFASKILKTSSVKVCTVIGFPLGMNTTNIKKQEAKEAIKNGADEIDMVINVGAVKEDNYNYVIDEIKELRKVTNKKILKVIIETCYLTDKEIGKMTKICNDTSVDFIKTSTGFGTRGASVKDVEIMNKNRNEKLQIKASGGIRDTKTAKEMISAGATRLGASSGVEIVKGE